MNYHRNTHTMILSSFLLASIAGLLLLSASSGNNSIYTLAQQMNGNTTAIATTDTTSQTMGNETALKTQQNHTQLCAPDFNGTIENIPWSHQGAPSTAQNQTHYPALIVDIQSLANENHCYRDEFKTTDHTQVVLMSLKPGEEIGLEVHNTLDQLLFFVQGTGMANISGQTFPIKEGDIAYIPAATVHNFVNTGDTDLKLYTIYSPRNHEPGTLQETKSKEAGYTPIGKIEEEH
jgi:mannose-6-phosphate isomerase-like protein (cupin superfamily)